MLKNLDFPKKSSVLLTLSLITLQLSFGASAVQNSPGAYVIEISAKDMGIKRLSENEPLAIVRKENPKAFGGFTYTLQKSLIIKAAENFNIDNVTIITNGHALYIEANDTLSAKSTIIKSFEDKYVSKVQPLIPAIPKEAGRDGLPGIKGINGNSSNTVHLKATRLIGNLSILNDGQNGGPGGPGGSGSLNAIKGADGKDYAPEKSLGDAGKVFNKLTGKKAVFRAEIFATPGLRGSPAGLPGPAGCGGDGGNAGPIILNAETYDLTLYYSQKGGNGGSPALNVKGELAHGEAGATGVGGKGGKRQDETLESDADNGPSAFASDHPRSDIFQKIMSGEFSKAGKHGTSSQPEIRSPEENKNKLPRGLTLKIVEQN